MNTVLQEQIKFIQQTIVLPELPEVVDTDALITYTGPYTSAHSILFTLKCLSIYYKKRISLNNRVIATTALKDINPNNVNLTAKIANYAAIGNLAACTYNVTTFELKYKYNIEALQTLQNYNKELSEYLSDDNITAIVLSKTEIQQPIVAYKFKNAAPNIALINLYRKITCLLPLLNNETNIPNWISEIEETQDELDILNILQRYIDTFDVSKLMLEQIKIELHELYTHATFNSELNNRIYEQEEVVKDYLQRIAIAYKEINRLRHKILDLEIPDAENYANEIINFLNQAKDISNVCLHGRGLYFTVTGPITFYDEDILTTYLNADNYNHISQAKPAIKTMLKKCFIDKEYELIFTATICIDLSKLEALWTGTRSYFNSIITIEPVKSYTALNNTHLVNYGCWGGHATDILMALQNKQFIYAINIIQSAVKNLNFADSTVCSRLFSTLEQLSQQYTVFRKKGDDTPLTLEEVINESNSTNTNTSQGNTETDRTESTTDENEF